MTDEKTIVIMLALTLLALMSIAQSLGAERRRVDALEQKLKGLAS